MDIKVTLLSGESCYLQVSPLSSVAQLKHIISQKFEVAPHGQRLIFERNGQNVSLDDDGRSLSSYHLAPGAQVRLLIINSTKMSVFLKNEKGITSTYEIPVDESVDDFKRKVHNKEGVAVSQMRLIHEGKEMADGCKLRDYNVRNDSTINLTFRLRGG